MAPLGGTGMRRAVSSSRREVLCGETTDEVTAGDLIRRPRGGWGGVASRPVEEDNGIAWDNPFEEYRLDAAVCAAGRPRPHRNAALRGVIPSACVLPRPLGPSGDGLQRGDVLPSVPTDALWPKVMVPGSLRCLGPSGMPGSSEAVEIGNGMARDHPRRAVAWIRESGGRQP